MAVCRLGALKGGGGASPLSMHPCRCPPPPHPRHTVHPKTPLFLKIASCSAYFFFCTIGLLWTTWTTIAVDNVDNNTFAKKSGHSHETILE